MAKKAKKPKGDDLAKRANGILDILEKTYPGARIYLDFKGPYQLLIATILAAQCTDEMVNQITPELFRRYPDPAALAKADPKALEELIHATGFFRQKTKSLLACSKALIEEHGGEVPGDVEALTAIRGVGRKTAAVVISNAFGGQAIAVDTHVKRVSTRLGLAKTNTPEKIERELCAVIPEKRWTRATQLIGTHGRRTCTARKPDCEHCPVNKLCDFYQDTVAG